MRGAHGPKASDALNPAFYYGGFARFIHTPYDDFSVAKGLGEVTALNASSLLTIYLTQHRSTRDQVRFPCRQAALRLAALAFGVALTATLDQIRII